MEKLQATKKQNDFSNSNIIAKKENDIIFDKKNKKNHINQQKNKKKLNNSNIFFCCIKHAWSNNKSKIITFILLFAIAIILNFSIISNTSYYVFLKKPKILENAITIQLVNTLFLTLLFGLYIFETYLDELKLYKKCTSKNESCNANFDINKLQKIDKNTKTDIDGKSTKKNKIFKKIAKNRQKNTNFKQFLIIFSLFLILLLAFLIKLLWLCVFIAFIIFFSLFVLLVRLKHKKTKIFCIVLILADICILLSFYFVYLLN